MVWIETPTNPLLKVIDIRAIAERAHARGVLVAVDNTFLTPYFQQPLGLGADLVMHSTTKYLGATATWWAGFIVGNDPAHGEKLRSSRTRSAPCRAVGCFLTLRV